jgi:hypothetical protein
MQPETNSQDDCHPDSKIPLTAGELAIRLKRSRYGVKTAIRRAGIHPVQVLGRISYYDPGIEKTLAAGMRAANLQPLTR